MGLRARGEIIGHSTGLTAAGLALLVVITLLGPNLAVAKRSSCDTGNIVYRGRARQTIKLPLNDLETKKTATSTPNQYTNYSVTVDPWNPSLIFAAGGAAPDGALYRSNDGGCNWKVVLELASSPLNQGFRSIQIGRHKPGAPAKVYAWATRSAGAFHSMFVSSDSGDTWQERPMPELRVRSYPQHFLVTPSDANRLYAFFANDALLIERPKAAYISTDGAKTWGPAGAESVSRPSLGSADPAPGDTIWGLPGAWAVDPLDKSTLWVLDAAKRGLLLSSTDGAESFKPVFQLPERTFHYLKVSHARGSDRMIIAMQELCRSDLQQPELVYVSLDGGRSFLDIPAPPSGQCELDTSTTGKVVWATHQQGFGADYRERDKMAVYYLSVELLGSGQTPWVKLPFDFTKDSTGPLQPQVSEGRQPVVDVYHRLDDGTHYIERLWTDRFWSQL